MVQRLKFKTTPTVGILKNRRVFDEGYVAEVLCHTSEKKKKPDQSDLIYKYIKT